MATKKEEPTTVQLEEPTVVAEEQDHIPSEHELLLEQYTNNGFILVQYIGSKTKCKFAVSPTKIVRQYGVKNYGFVCPREFLLVHRKDAEAAPHLYRRPTAKEKPAKEVVVLHQNGTKPAQIIVTWAGMPKDELDPFNRV